MVVLVLPPVSGFPVASPCLWGKLQNLSFCHVANCENWRKSRTKCGWFASTCLVSSRWFSCGFAVSMGEAAKPPFECVQAGCHVVLRGRRGTFWHSNLFDDVSKMSKLEEASYEMLVFLHPRVLSRVAGFPVASPCLWGKLENISYSNVSKPVVHTLHSALHTRQQSMQVIFSLILSRVIVVQTCMSIYFQVGDHAVWSCCLVVMFYWLGFVRFRLCSAWRFWSAYTDADVRSARLNSFPGFCRLQSCLLDCWERLQHIALAVDRHRVKHVFCEDVCFQCCS